MEEKKYTIAEDFKLPSKGLIYDKPVDEHVRLRSMTTRDEMKRTGRTDRPNTLFAEVIEDCMIEKPSVHVADMCYGDYEYLLHKLRVVSLGEKYDMTAICPFCGNVEDLSVDLDKEEIVTMDANEFKELLKVKLPKSGKEVTLNFTTPRILDNVKIRAEELEKESKGSNQDFEKVAKLQEAISLVDGNKLSYIDKYNFILNLELRDMNKLLNRLDKIDLSIGLKSEVKFSCSKCKQDVRTFFRYTTEFFKPSDD